MRMQRQGNCYIFAKRECQQKAYLAAMEDRSVGQRHLDKECLIAPIVAFTFVVFATPSFYFCMAFTGDLIQPVFSTNTYHMLDYYHMFDNYAYDSKIWKQVDFRLDAQDVTHKLLDCHTIHIVKSFAPG